MGNRSEIQIVETIFGNVASVEILIYPM